MKKTKSSVYRITELVGTSTESWEDAAKNAVQTASRSLRERCRKQRNAHAGEYDLPVFEQPGAHDRQQLACRVIARARIL